MSIPQTTSFKQLVSQLERKFEQVQADALTQAKAELNAKLAQMLGTTPEASVRIVKKATNGKHKPRKAKIAIKFRDPANPENTWSGRGRPARWLGAYEKQGRKREEFAVRR